MCILKETSNDSQVREGRVPQLDTRRPHRDERTLNDALREFMSEHVAAKVAKLKELPKRLVQVGTSVLAYCVIIALNSSAPSKTPGKPSRIESAGQCKPSWALSTLRPGSRRSS